MAPTKTLCVLCASAFFLISALAVVALPTSPAAAEAGTNLAGAELHDVTILHIGGGDLASQLVDRLAEVGAEVVSSTYIPEAVELDPDSVIIFGGEWFEQRAYDNIGLSDFLRLASLQGAGMVMVGGATSAFFEALDMAGAYGIPAAGVWRARNPAHFNPPLAGLRMKTVDGYVGPSFLFCDGSSPDVLQESLIGWLQSTTPAVMGAPYLRFVTEYNYWPLLDSAPYGRLDLTVPIYKLMGDHVPDYDWYLYQVNLQSVPGKMAYPSSPWVNDYTWAHHQVFAGGAGRWLVDYAPGTAYGATTVDVSFLPDFGRRPWSYSIKDVKVLALRDYIQHRVSWQHDINQGKPVAETAYLSAPGFVVKTTQDNWSFIDAWYQVRFAKPFAWWWSTRTVGPSPRLILDAFQAGD